MEQNLGVFHAEMKLGRLRKDPRRLAGGKQGGAGEKPEQEPWPDSATAGTDLKTPFNCIHCSSPLEERDQVAVSSQGEAIPFLKGCRWFRLPDLRHTCKTLAMGNFTTTQAGS